MKKGSSQFLEEIFDPYPIHTGPENLDVSDDFQALFLSSILQKHKMKTKALVVKAQYISG